MICPNATSDVGLVAHVCAECGGFMHLCVSGVPDCGWEACWGCRNGSLGQAAVTLDRRLDERRAEQLADRAMVRSVAVCRPPVECCSGCGLDVLASSLEWGLCVRCVSRKSGVGDQLQLSAEAILESLR